jgi:hypothetical protein
LRRKSETFFTPEQHFLIPRKTEESLELFENRNLIPALDMGNRARSLTVLIIGKEFLEWHIKKQAAVPRTVATGKGNAGA